MSSWPVEFLLRLLESFPVKKLMGLADQFLSDTYLII